MIVVPGLITHYHKESPRSSTSSHSMDISMSVSMFMSISGRAISGTSTVSVYGGASFAGCNTSRAALLGALNGTALLLGDATVLG